MPWGLGVTIRMNPTLPTHMHFGSYRSLQLYRCSTCHLNSYACPGHAGHIELPAPIYHPTFMDQLLRLLRARCAYCNHLKLHPAEVNRLACKLRLVRYGLLKEAEELENIRSSSKTKQGAGANGSTVDGVGISSDESEDDSIRLHQRRNDFVKRSIKKAGGKTYLAAASRDKIEAIYEQRRALIKEFLVSITKGKYCGTCKGYVTPEHDGKIDSNLQIEFLRVIERMDTTKSFRSR